MSRYGAMHGTPNTITLYVSHCDLQRIKQQCEVEEKYFVKSLLQLLNSGAVM